MSAFVLEKGTPGFRSGKKENKLGIRASDTAEVVLEDCFVPDENLLGRARRGIQAGDGGARRRPHLDRRARSGHGDRRVRDRLDYAKEREQFGQPIAAVPGDPVSRSPRWRRASPPPRC